MLPLYSNFPTKGTQPVTWAIIALCAVVAFIELVASGRQPAGDFYLAYGAHPALVMFDFLPWNQDSLSIAWTALTSMFVHAGLLHLLGNMLFFYCFSLPVEYLMGSVRYAVFYVLCGLVGVVVHSAFNPSSFEPLVGASGAVAGVLAAHTLLLPWTRIETIGSFFGSRSVPAWGFTALWLGLQVVQSLDSTSDVAFGAHAGGILAGVMLAPLFVKSGVLLIARPVEDTEHAMEYDEGIRMSRPAAAAMALVLIGGLGAVLFTAPSSDDPSTVANGREWVAIARIDGVGVPLDVASGLAIYRDVAKQDADIAKRLADALHSGKILPKDEAEAVQWYRRAAEAKQPAATLFYALALIDGNTVPRDIDKGMALLLDLAKDGYSSGDLQLGLVLESGRGGTTVDLAGAARHYQQACDNNASEHAKTDGRDDACRRYAQMLKEGRGVPRDPEKAQKVLDQIQTRQLIDAAMEQLLR